MAEIGTLREQMSAYSALRHEQLERDEAQRVKKDVVKELEERKFRRSLVQLPRRNATLSGAGAEENAVGDGDNDVMRVHGMSSLSRPVRAIVLSIPLLRMSQKEVAVASYVTFRDRAKARISAAAERANERLPLAKEIGKTCGRISRICVRIAVLVMKHKVHDLRRRVGARLAELGGYEQAQESHMPPYVPDEDAERSFNSDARIDQHAASLSSIAYSEKQRRAAQLGHPRSRL